MGGTVTSVRHDATHGRDATAANPRQLAQPPVEACSMAARVSEPRF